jgi:hypothetical protein
MRTLICSIIFSGFTATGLMAQKLEIQPLDPKKVTRVETAKDHLTVIELGDPVTMVAVGNLNAFTIERRENKVFVKPVEDEAQTNLFIWTSSGRFAYELVPAQAVEQMHFVIDQAPALASAKIQAPPEKQSVQRAAPLPADMLTKAKPILLHGDRQTQGRVEIALRDLYRERLRAALQVVDAISQGRSLWIATCNSITSLPPELRRRFTLGTFFFDLPDVEERELIWKIYREKWVLSGDQPEDEGWTGAEIKECCRKAWRLRLSLGESASYIVPVSRSAADQIESLRRQASGRFLSASRAGVYTFESGPQAIVPAKRAFREMAE